MESGTNQRLTRVDEQHRPVGHAPIRSHLVEHRLALFWRVGHAGLELKLKRWETMQKGTTWRARSVSFGKNLICIEWDAKVTLNDGRVVPLAEVAIHEIRGGKIARERFYYNPMALMPASS